MTTDTAVAQSSYGRKEEVFTRLFIYFCWKCHQYLLRAVFTDCLRMFTCHVYRVSREAVQSPQRVGGQWPRRLHNHRVGPVLDNHSNAVEAEEIRSHSGEPPQEPRADEESPGADVVLGSDWPFHDAHPQDTLGACPRGNQGEVSECTSSRATEGVMLFALNYCYLSLNTRLVCVLEVSTSPGLGVILYLCHYALTRYSRSALLRQSRRSSRAYKCASDRRCDGCFAFFLSLHDQYVPEVSTTPLAEGRLLMLRVVYSPESLSSVASCRKDLSVAMLVCFASREVLAAHTKSVHKIGHLLK